MGQHIHIIENTYNKVAKEYAKTFSGEHEKKPKDQEILKRFSQEVKGKKPVWDFGCGPGQTTRYLKDLGVDISGLDLSENTLDQAKALHPDIHFQKGNILKLDFQDSSITGITAFYAIVHFSKKQLHNALGEIFRVLKPGGLFLFTFHLC